MNFNNEEVVVLEDGGKYYAEVSEAVNHTAKSTGKESIKLVFDLFGTTSRVGQLPVYITPKFAKLFKHGIVAMLGEEKFKSNIVDAEDFVGKNCIVQVGIETGEYEGRKTEKFIVRDILKSESNVVKPTISQAQPTHETTTPDDGLPF